MKNTARSETTKTASAIFHKSAEIKKLKECFLAIQMIEAIFLTITVQIIHEIPTRTKDESP